MEVKDKTKVVLQVTPERALTDEQVAIQLTGSEPGSIITIIATTTDDTGQKFESQATFEADELGEVDLVKQKPIEGTYAEADAMGLFWSMEPVQRVNTGFTKHSAVPQTVYLTAYEERKALAHAKVERCFYLDDVTSIEVDVRELVGQLYLPKTKTNCPGVIIVGGSDAAVHEQAAALLASNGYAALALAYYAAEGLPKGIQRIPLEYVETALQWLGEQDQVNKEKLGIVGFSRGSELALLAGTVFPQLKAIIAVAPSALMFSGNKNLQMINEPAWTYKGVELPYFLPKSSPREFFRFLGNWLTAKPISNLSGAYAALNDKEKVNQTIIPVEKIQGKMMFICGEDDQLQPAIHFSKMLTDRLREHGDQREPCFVSYKDAGHFSAFPAALPYLPTTRSITNRGKMTMTFGGTAKGSAKAAEHSFREVLLFLKKTFESES
ncbi:acyl-CoA thioester hydrolase/BAAT C-terminal domain-containing protein [Shouchella patagoniensis]|uniref:acyl-CoA thioester hydrolase/BAAT C-terminal domain-containing protein n=1 Tax=Shouchella patagoniensis TaxID=228576 RepID=UPI0009953106|nr:acyl-CoA thioester hydrolase/BAAT C-terminal domain-containing protein [Shouchella patagoniensis]